MRISETRPASGPLPARTIALEALAVSALAVSIAALLAPGDIGLKAIHPHPIWLGVALMAARYGTRGLAAGVMIGWAVTVAVAVVLRVPPAVLGARVSSGPDLGALLAVILIGWVASSHERRTSELGIALAALQECCASDASALAALRSTAVVLRGRADRLETSLTFLRDVAARMEGNDPAAAAQAAIELAVARIGARVGWVTALEGDRLTSLGSTGPWTPAPAPDTDRTIAAALRLRRPARALDLSEATAGDSDLAAPILTGEEGRLIGVIALRGVPQGGASAAALHDLALIASWCSGALAARRFVTSARSGDGHMAEAVSEIDDAAGDDAEAVLDLEEAVGGGGPVSAQDYESVHEGVQNGAHGASHNGTKKDAHNGARKGPHSVARFNR
jgi:hypothetical protein